MKKFKKKKVGFTLIELLAVIVILAIIALITMPVITGVIEKARKSAAKSSALGYISAIEMKIATDKFKGIDYIDKEDYVYDEINVKVKGSKPTGGIYSLYKNIITKATFCINNYVVTYQNNKTEVGEKCNADDMKLVSTLSVSKTSLNLTYPEHEDIDIIENTSNGELSCSSSDSKVATCEISENKVIVKSGKKEGHTTITLTSAATSKYKEAQAAILVSSEEGLLSVSANGYEGVYDGNAHGITVTSSDSTIKYGTTEGTYDLAENPTYIDVGEYTVYYEVSKEGYKTIHGSKTISITKANGSVVAPTAKTLTFNGNAQELVNAGSSSTGTIYYKLGDGEYSTNIPSAINAGTYTVYYKVVGDANHKDVADSRVSVTIKQSLSQVVALGDYVKMTPSYTSYVIFNGYIYPSQMKYWRVINIKSDGTIELVSEYSQGDVRPGGERAYQDYIGSYNNVAAKYYNDTYTVSTHTVPYFRGMGYNGQTRSFGTKLTADSANNYSFAPSEINGSFATPLLANGDNVGVEYDGGVGGDTKYINDVNLVINAYKVKNRNLSDEEALRAYKLETNELSNYLIASRYFIRSYTTYYWSARICHIYNGCAGNHVGIYMYNTSNGNSAGIDKAYPIRIIITLKSGIAKPSGDGQSLETAWNLN